jgi:hypothetical protein
LSFIKARAFNSVRHALASFVILSIIGIDTEAKEAPGLLAIEAIRNGYRTAAQHNRAHERFERAAAEGFNRLHPGSKLGRHTNVPRDRAERAGLPVL